MAENFWGAVKELIGGAHASPKTAANPPGLHVVFFNLIFLPALTFLKSYLFDLNIFKGRKGFSSAVHGSVLMFGIQSIRYEALAAGDKAELQKIRKEF